MASDTPPDQASRPAGTAWHPTSSMQEKSEPGPPTSAVTSSTEVGNQAQSATVANTPSGVTSKSPVPQARGPAQDHPQGQSEAHISSGPSPSPVAQPEKNDAASIAPPSVPLPAHRPIEASHQAPILPQERLDHGQYHHGLTYQAVDGKQIPPYHANTSQPVSQFMPNHVYHYSDPHRGSVTVSGLHRNFDGKDGNFGSKLRHPMPGEAHLEQTGHFTSMPISNAQVQNVPIVSHVPSDNNTPPTLYQPLRTSASPLETRGGPYLSGADGKTLEKIEPYNGDFYGQSQTPTYIQHQNTFVPGNERTIPPYSMPQQVYQTYHPAQSSAVPPQSQTQHISARTQQPLTYVTAEHNVAIYSEDDQNRQRQDVYDGGDRYRLPGDRSYQGDDLHGQGYSTLPPARNLAYPNGVRATTTGYGTDVLNRPEAVAADTNRTAATSGLTRQDRKSSIHPKGWYGPLVSESLRVLPATSHNAAERNDFVHSYSALMSAYEEKYDELCDAVDKTCLSIMIDGRIPYLMDTVTAPVDDETPEDANEKLLVKKEFVEAMEKLQGDQLPTKRRGNLPKESTAYLKKWFNDHYDRPYPTDEEKLMMSKKTNIAVQQISHWFINYRKRVWKPSLPPDHPAHLEGNKRPRKRARRGDSGSSHSNSST